ncbi:hypothetical protein A3A71_03490 [Candidatus Berkelbacteria bacterium RIFCSPLOWO2_01_FULL_50_28]|uniref:GGDEF domain-containing protein n=1 Tax=Candidatus Berkelbacteria bacterium RIFCSPLOWO2_01_FULL_50_28 TaxID=1797471 RepID=A0A1F5ECI3_9BACT|nr:MAG: hypothetical protein A2807_03055 [Candidatus Berkelbacteria bacterium RIFCSPHIGHO2_01_FULL_50_36]OGD63642.1 MAG: hypothetical protein A3F39_04265 [Candidatus Berkelbacteria bacterium RIFCSPHIGHO2_12_FULL_50_11]OGD65118.1 MAG: hypothetical protein A3A71_03490 [Candidatus Berkelbacteria bacterium RIFCSPLOWO2_01_FULL_50_28]
MSPKLLERLFEQIKRVFSKRVALTNEHGQVYRNFSDFGTRKGFPVRSFSREQMPAVIEESDDLQAVPIYYDDKFICLVVIEVPSADAQTAQIVSSLGELVAEQFVLQHRPRPDAIDLLLTRVAHKGETIDHEEFQHQLAALGHRLDLQRAALAIELKGFHEHYLRELGSPGGDRENLIAAKKRDISHSLMNFFTKNPDNLVGFIGDDTFLVLKDLQNTDYERFCELIKKSYREITGPLRNVHIKEVTMGVGTAATSPAGILRSVTESLEVLKIGSRVLGSDKVHQYEALGILPLIATGAAQQKKAFAANIEESLKDDQLLQTLQAFLEASLNLTSAAEALHVHRNTVIYRLDRITEKLGKDPRKFADAVELHLGLMFSRIFPD